MAGMAEGLVRRPATPSGPGTVRGVASGTRHRAPSHGPQGTSLWDQPSQVWPGQDLPPSLAFFLISLRSVFFKAPPRGPIKGFRTPSLASPEPH